eukprot:Sdes_comp18089_c0_seq1m7514
MLTKRCFHCKASEVDLFKCSQCKIASYCSKPCQKKNWKDHKSSCIRLSHYQVDEEEACQENLIEKKTADINLKSLFGKTYQDLQIQTYLECFSTQPNGVPTLSDSKQFPENILFMNFKTVGLSFCYENEKLSAIHFYNAGVDGYSQFPGKLPCGLKFSDTNVHVVKKLGEPSDKGGGGSIPIWITYMNR